MSETLKGELTVSTHWSFTGTVTGRLPRVADETTGKRLVFTSGAGAGQCDQAYSSVLSIPASSFTDLDLAASLTNLLGTPSSVFARVKGIMFRLLSAVETSADGTAGTACASVSIGGGASNPWLGPLGGTTPKHDVQNGGWYAWGTPTASGWPVTPASAQNLRITNNDAGVAAQVEIVVWGSRT